MLIFSTAARASCNGNYVEGVTIKRDSINLRDGSAGTDYGHWWIEIDTPNGKVGYGWWPTPYVGLLDTLFGVPGSLNRGLATDLHTGDPAQQYLQVRLPDGKTSDQVKQEIQNWVANFQPDTWRWPFGWNCHTYQEKMLQDLGLTPCEPTVLEEINHNWPVIALPTFDFTDLYTDQFGNPNQAFNNLMDDLWVQMSHVPEGEVTIGECKAVEDQAFSE